MGLNMLVLYNRRVPLMMGRDWSLVLAHVEEPSVREG